MARIVAWFNSRNGQRFTYACIGTACFSTLGGMFLIHGPFIENIREMVGLYKKDIPKPLSNKVQEVVKEFFYVIGEDLCHLGGTNSPWGTAIGLPFYFESPEDLNFGALRIRGHESADWIIEGQDLMTALTIPDNAKKFAIMREIYSCDIWEKLENSLIIPACIIFSAFFAKRVNAYRNAFTKSLKSRLGVYGGCYLTGYFLYRLLKDPAKHISDKKSDELAALTGPDYLEGGIKFYEHMLMRNKALRELYGKRGEKMYDPNGNENYFILAPKLPTSKRLELLIKLKENHVKES